MLFRSARGRQQRYGREQALKAVDISVSIDALRKVVVANKADKEKIETRDKTGVLDLVLAEIDRRKGLATNVSEQCKPHKPRKKTGNGG